MTGHGTASMVVEVGYEQKNMLLYFRSFIRSFENGEPFLATDQFSRQSLACD